MKSETLPIYLSVFLGHWKYIQKNGLLMSNQAGDKKSVPTEVTFHLLNFK